MLPKPGVSGTLLKNTFFWHKNLFQGWNFYLCIRPLLKKTYVFERERYIESTVGRRGRRSREPDMTRAYIPGPLWLDFRILESWPELKAHA